MAGTIWLFIDEFGNPNFGLNGSRHFGLASVATEEPAELSRQVDALRHRIWSREHLQRGYFHAREDCWQARQAMFELLAQAPIVRCDVIALTKANVHRERRAPKLLYNLALRQLFAEVGQALGGYERLVVVTAELKPLVQDLPSVVRSALANPTDRRAWIWRGSLDAFQLPAAAHGGLQLADYVSWASNRARSAGDDRWIPYARGSRPWSDHTVFRE